MTPTNERRIRKALKRIDRVLDSAEPEEMAHAGVRLKAVAWMLQTLLGDCERGRAGNPRPTVSYGHPCVCGSQEHNSIDGRCSKGPDERRRQCSTG